MSKQELARARDLIEQKRYHEARAILQTLDNTTAQYWLVKLDALMATSPVVTPKRTNWKGSLLIIGAVVLIFGFFAVRSMREATERGAVMARLFGYCLDIYGDLNNLDDMDNCHDWYISAFATYNDEIMACHRVSPELDAPFNDCLIDEEILPPGIFRR